MTGKYRIFISGGGTIGLYLAERLQGLGHEVFVYERKANVTGKVCSGLISARLGRFIPEAEKFALHRINSCDIFFGSKKVELTMNPQHWVVDRDGLNLYLLDRARQAGVKIFLNSEIKELPEGFDKYIFCDGCNAKTRALAGMGPQKYHFGMQIFKPLQDECDKVQTWAHSSGFFWRIPRGQNVEWGVIGKPAGLAEKFRNFCEKNNVELDERELQVAMLPIGLEFPSENKMTACGDSAGLIKPWSGGGVIWGLTAADMLIENIDDFSLYQKRANRYFGWYLGKGNIVKNLVYLLGFKAPYLLPSHWSRDNDFPLI